MKLQSILKLVWVLILVTVSKQSCAMTNIDVYYFDSHNDFIKNFNSSLELLSARRSSQVNIYTADGNAELQLEQIAQNSGNGNPMIVNLVNPEDASKVIDLAQMAQNRVIFFNRIPNPEVMNSYDKVWYVGAYSEQSGAYQAQLINDYMNLNKKFIDRNNNGKIDVIILQGEKLHQDTIVRTKSVLDLLYEKGNDVNILSQNHSNWSRELAKRDVNAQIIKFGISNIDMIISNNDAMALGAVDALNALGYNQEQEKGQDVILNSQENYIPVFGVDGIPEALRAVRSGKLTGTVYSDFSALAKVCIDLAKSDLLTDEELTQQIWYRVKNKYVTLPYLKFAKFKNYLFESHRYPQDGVSYE